MAFDSANFLTFIANDLAYFFEQAFSAKVKVGNIAQINKRIKFFFIIIPLDILEYLLSYYTSESSCRNKIFKERVAQIAFTYLPDLKSRKVIC